MHFFYRYIGKRVEKAAKEVRAETVKEAGVVDPW